MWKKIISIFLFIFIVINFKVVSNAAVNIEVVRNDDSVKQIQTNKIKVTMYSDGYYGLMLLPDRTAFFNSEVSKT